MQIDFDEIILFGCFSTMIAMLMLPIILLRKEQIKYNKKEDELKTHSLKLLCNGWFLIIGQDHDSEKLLKKLVDNSGCIPSLCILNLLNICFETDRQKIQNWMEFNSNINIYQTPFYLNLAELRKEPVDINETLEETKERLIDFTLDQEKLYSSSSNGESSGEEEL